MMMFFLNLGIRVTELCQLNKTSIQGRYLTVIGKGNKERTVYLDEVAGMMLQEYLAGRTDDVPALFINRYQDRINPNGVRAMLKELAKRAGVDHVHPHKFRRTLATGLARRGMPIQEVAKVLGHEKLDTTMKYVVLNKDDIKASYRRAT